MKTKKIYFNFLFIAFFLFTASSYSQSISGQHSGQQTQSTHTMAPPSSDQILSVTNLVNYQAVARNASGNILANQLIGLRLTIEDGFGGPVLYQERQTPTTNLFGLFTIELGNGTILSGTWSGIVWSNGNQWLKVDMDPTGGSSYTTMGESQLLSVPFSNFAATTAAVSGTTNNIGKFTGPGTIGNSRITDDGTYIRFGTTSGLQIYDFGADNNCDINIHNNGAGEAYFYADRLASTDNGGLAIGSAAAVKWLVGAYGNDDFSFLNATLGTSAVNILLSNNNVGIGTVSPGNKLHVVDATSFANSIYGENTYVGTADGTGVFGRSENAPNYGRGVVGIGGYIGVLGETSGGADPNTEYGVFANSMGSAGTRVGIYASASGGAVNWAGLFDGAVDVQGKVISNYDYPDFNMHSQPYLQSTLPFPSMSIIGNGGTEGVVLGLDGPNALGVFDTTGSAFAAINASAFNVTSDRRVKNSIEDITSAQYETYLAQIRTIESATYFYNNEQRDNKHVGFIAQSLPKEVINVNKAAKPGMPENLLMYNLSDMMGLSVIGIKALDSKQTQMEQELKKEIADLRAEIQQLKNNK